MLVYRHIRLDKNEVFYIGIGTDEKRAYTKSSRNKYWKHIVNKTDYEVEIMLDNLTEEQAKQKEIEFIKLYGRKDLGLGTLVNMTDGADGTIGYAHTDEFKINRSINYKGKNTWTTGTKQSDKTRKKRSESMKGKNTWMKGRTLPKETCQKISKANSGENNYFYGKNRSDEWKQNQSKKMKNRYTKELNPFAQPYEIDGIYFGCRKNAEIHFNKCFNTIKKYHSVIKLERNNNGK